MRKKDIMKDWENHGKLICLNEELRWIREFKKLLGGMMLICVYSYIEDREIYLESEITRLTGDSK